MKNPPDIQKLEQFLRSSKLVAGGFLGNDTRALNQIIDSDHKTLTKLRITNVQLAEKMTEITQLAKKGLGNWVKIDSHLQARIEEAKGFLVCPWPHPHRSLKRVTFLKNTNTNQTINWSDLNTHLIAEHCFFEGKGSAFRIEPEIAAEILF